LIVIMKLQLLIKGTLEFADHFGSKCWL